MKAYDQVFQGDVWVMRLPDDMPVPREAELPHKFGKLVVQEGEMTGHHHYVDTVMDRPKEGAMINEAALESLKDEETSFDALKSVNSIFGNAAKEPSAKLYSAGKLAEQLVKDQVLLRADLVVGLLEINNGPMKLYHQEHSAIGLPPGKYIVGRQIESVAGEERRVAD
jgi:hypothetical protein